MFSFTPAVFNSTNVDVVYFFSYVFLHEKGFGQKDIGIFHLFTNLILSRSKKP